MDLQEVKNLLNIDFQELQSGFCKLSKNQYYIIQDYFIVKLSGEKWMIVSNNQQTINLLTNHIWHFHNQGYAGTNINGTLRAEPRVRHGPRPTIKLFHQMYLRYGQGLVVDHINHLKTDNRYENLRVVTYRQNSRNMKKRHDREHTGICVQMCGSCNYVVAYINHHKQLKKYYNVDKNGMEECMRQAIIQRKAWEQEYLYSSNS